MQSPEAGGLNNKTQVTDSIQQLGAPICRFKRNLEHMYVYK